MSHTFKAGDKAKFCDAKEQVSRRLVREHKLVAHDIYTVQSAYREPFGDCYIRLKEMPEYNLLGNSFIFEW